MKRRRFLLGAGAASVVLVAGGPAIVVRDEADSAAGDPSASTAAGTATAEVTRRDLAGHEELDGTIGYGDHHRPARAGVGDRSGPDSRRGRWPRGAVAVR